MPERLDQAPLGRVDTYQPVAQSAAERTGIRSSRQIERCCHEDIAFRILSGNSTRLLPIFGGRLAIGGGVLALGAGHLPVDDRLLPAGQRRRVVRSGLAAGHPVPSLGNWSRVSAAWSRRVASCSRLAANSSSNWAHSLRRAAAWSRPGDVLLQRGARRDREQEPGPAGPGQVGGQPARAGLVLDDTFGATGALGEGNFRGSGTSQAAAVISGAAALILQQRPAITPDQLKKLLTSTATALPAVKPEGQGKGVVNLAKALTTATPST